MFMFSRLKKSTTPYLLLKVKKKLAYRSIALHPLCSLYGVVQTGPAQVYVLRMGIGA